MTSNGSQDGLCKSLEMLTDPGDSLVVEDHTFFATFSILNPIEANYVPVESDQHGMRPDSLFKALTERQLLFRPSPLETD